jgi:hypothetical protein
MRVKTPAGAAAVACQAELVFEGAEDRFWRRPVIWMACGGMVSVRYWPASSGAERARPHRRTYCLYLQGVRSTPPL